MGFESSPALIITNVNLIRMMMMMMTRMTIMMMTKTMKMMMMRMMIGLKLDEQVGWSGVAGY